MRRRCTTIATSPPCPCWPTPSRKPAAANEPSSTIAAVPGRTFAAAASSTPSWREGLPAGRQGHPCRLRPNWYNERESRPTARTSARRPGMTPGTPATHPFVEEVQLQGHIIDSLLLPKVLDEILTGGGSYVIKDIRVGQRQDDPSFA